MNKYLTHIPITEEVTDLLRYEFYNNIDKAVKYTAKDKTLDAMEVIRNEDAEDCVFGHKIADNLKYMIAHEVKPRYYRQQAGSDLNAHRDYNATVALNVVLEGSGPIVFDNEHEIHYTCALIDVTQIHSVRTEDTRVLFRLTMNGISYEEVLDAIQGAEDDIFCISP